MKKKRIFVYIFLVLITVILVIIMQSPEEIKKLPADGGPQFNRLVFEKSPYLLQHAGNPVDWYPWGEEAFTRALKEDKPIFLSIGYSTCHWCHVMERESFEDSEVAALLNESFVCIKVDREERPDLDQIYMSVCQTITGSGGWPLTIIMTPEKKPFYAGTYFPKNSKFQRIGLMELLPKIDELWKTQRAKLLESANQIVQYLKKNTLLSTKTDLTETDLITAFHQLENKYDSKYGGFGTAPKFPSPHNFTFLLRYWHRTKEPKALEMVEISLQQMRLGGIFDHVGFGFHRYSTDAQWLLPHFEKMLYDQALLAMAYLEAFQATENPFYADTAREIFTYVLRDMTSPEGGFYSAEDADSEGEEGLFYLWTPEELIRILGEKEAEFIISMFNLKNEGNFFDQATGQKTGKNILYRKQSIPEIAAKLKLTESDLKKRWEKARIKLFNERKKRIPPLKDDKILTDWNGLMIAALAKGASVLNEPEYANAAGHAADFVWKNLRDKKGRLLKRYRDGESALPAHLDDYAFMVWGLLELHEATFEVKYLQMALQINDIMLSNFWDHENGGLFFAADSLNELLVRNKEIYDGAIPSGNSIAALNLLRLGRITANPTQENKAVDIGRVFSNQVKSAPAGYTQLLSAINFALGPSFEVVIAGVAQRKDTHAMIKALHKAFVPNKVILFRPTNIDKPPILEIAAYTEFQVSRDGKATAYVCQNYACNTPTTNIEKMLSKLNE